MNDTEPMVQNGTIMWKSVTGCNNARKLDSAGAGTGAGAGGDSSQ